MKAKEDIKDESEPKTTDDTKQQSSGESDEGIRVTEEYQKRAHELISKSSKHEIAHCRNCINDREDELRKAEMKESDKKGGKPSEYTAEPGY